MDFRRGGVIAGAKADARAVVEEILTSVPLPTGGHRQIMIADKNYFGAGFKAGLAEAGIDLLRPTRKGESQRPGSQFFKPFRQVIESIFETFKDQLSLELHRGTTFVGGARVSRSGRWR